MAKNEQELVEKIAHLSRIKISKEDNPNLSDILDFVNKINKVDADNVEVMAHPLKGTAQRLREDKVTETNEVESLQAIAPSKQDNFYTVPEFMNSSKED